MLELSQFSRLDSAFAQFLALQLSLQNMKMITFEKAAVTDFLTGLSNRRQLLRLGIPLLALANRNNCLAVAMIDIDFFKRVNDTYGHDVGNFSLSTGILS
jgi:PleD family two-component response regulator